MKNQWGFMGRWDAGREPDYGSILWFDISQRKSIPPTRKRRLGNRTVLRSSRSSASPRETTQECARSRGMLHGANGSTSRSRSVNSFVIGADRSIVISAGSALLAAILDSNV